jgi:hypothetical protein
MTALLASEDFSKFAFVLLVPIAIGVPCVLFGAVMTLSSIYEKRQAPGDKHQHVSRKLQVGVLLIILGISSLVLLAGVIISATH